MDNYLNANIQRINPDLVDIVKEFIPLKSEEYHIESVSGTTKKWTCELKCKIKTSEEVAGFIEKYLNITDETLKPCNIKKCGPKSPYIINNYYRCHHDTRYQKTREVLTSSSNPDRRVKNTYCPFHLTIKVLKETGLYDYPCLILIEHEHNHPIKALQSFSFKSISVTVANSIRLLFKRNMSPSLAYHEFIQQLRSDCNNDVEFHIKKQIDLFVRGVEILTHSIENIA